MAKTKTPKRAKNKTAEDGIDIESIGPVDQIHIPIPEGGGVVVLKGPNGAGKTKTLEATEALVSGNARLLSASDGAEAGLIDGFGAVLRVGRTTRKAGELEVVSIVGKFSVADLVDPGFKDPDTCDAARVKALIQLAGKTAEESDFKELFESDDQFKEIVGDELQDLSSMVEMAGKVKRQCESAARKLESQAGKKETEGQGIIDATEPELEGLPEGTLEDEQAELTKAIREQSRLEGVLESLEAGKEKRAEAAEQIEKLRENAGDVEKLGTVADAKADIVAEANEKVERLKEELATAEADAKEAQREYRQACQKKDDAIQANDEIKKLESILSGGSDESEENIREALETAKQTADELTDKVSALKGAERLRERFANGKALKAEAERLNEQAEALRDIGYSTDEVLSQAVSGITTADLRIERGRLVTETNRGTTEFHELSHGERWKIAIQVAIDIVKKAAEENGKPPLLISPQESWEALDPNNRDSVKEMLTGSGVVLLTALADVGELRAEALE